MGNFAPKKEIMKISSTVNQRPIKFRPEKIGHWGFDLFGHELTFWAPRTMMEKICMWEGLTPLGGEDVPTILIRDFDLNIAQEFIADIKALPTRILINTDTSGKHGDWYAQSLMWGPKLMVFNYNIRALSVSSDTKFVSIPLDWINPHGRWLNVDYEYLARSSL